MIEKLTGQCSLKHLTGIIIDVAGIGYGVEMTDAALAEVAPSTTPMTVWVYTHVREDTLRLFGFLTYEERALFNLLLTVSGVGPKLAMGILSRLSAMQIAIAVEKDDSDVLEDVPGIGARQSKKILLELKPKIQKLMSTGVFAALAAEQGQLSLEDKIGAVAGTTAAAVGPVKKKKTLDKSMVADLQSALENFGYKDKEVAPLLRRYERQPPAFDVGELIRLALAELSGARRAEGAKPDARPLEDLF